MLCECANIDRSNDDLDWDNQYIETLDDHLELTERSTTSNCR